jgi:hypothetical protein
MIYFAIVTGCFFIVGLGVFIFSQLKKVRVKKEQQQTILDRHLQEHNERQKYVSSSINILTKALEAGQIEVVEASIRLKVLVDQLKPAVEQNSFPVIEQIFAKTQHIPKLKEWKALDKKQRKKFTQDISLIEHKYADEVKVEVKQIAQMMSQRA